MNRIWEGVEDRKRYQCKIWKDIDDLEKKRVEDRKRIISLKTEVRRSKVDLVKPKKYEEEQEEVENFLASRQKKEEARKKKEGTKKKYEVEREKMYPRWMTG